MGFDKGQSKVSGRLPLVGAIFMCNRATMRECFRRKLFGLPSGKADFVGHVKAGMILFLFEYERRELHGVFRAISDGSIDIVPHAYSDSGMQFRAQVRFTTILRCSPLSEDEFSGAIRENYFSPNKFNFGLSERQVEKLLQLFSSSKLQRQLHHRKSPQNKVRRSSTPNYVSSPPEGEIDGGYSNLGGERYEQNVVPGSRSVRSPEYSENTTNFIRRAMDEYASITIGNDRRLNGGSYVPVTPIEDVGDLIVSNNVAVERPVHQENWQSTVGDFRNEINANFVHSLDGGSRFSEPILATDRRRGSRTADYDPPVSSEQRPDRRLASRDPGYDSPISIRQQPGVSQYPNPPVYDLQHISTGRRTGSMAPGYDPHVSSEQQPGVSKYPNPPVYDLEHISTGRRIGSMDPGYDPPVSSEQQPSVSQYPSPPVYGRNSILETNSLVGNDLQRTSIVHRSPAEQSYSPLQPYPALSVLETLPRPSLIFNGRQPATSGRPGTGNIHTQPYNPEAPRYNDTDHLSPLIRVSSSFPDESLATLNGAAYRAARHLRNDSSLPPRYDHSNLSGDNDEASYASNMLSHSSLSNEFFFPRPSLPPQPLPSENQSGCTAFEEHSLLPPPVINTPSVSGRRHVVTTSREGNISQSGSAHEEVPCSRNNIPNSKRTHDSRRSDYGAYSPANLYGGQDADRMYSDQQNRNKRSVFDRMVFPTTQERDRDSTTNFVGEDDDDKDDFSVSKIMASLKQSRYRWLNDNKPAKFLNGRRDDGAHYQVGNNKRQIFPPETKHDDHLEISVVPVEDDDDALMKNGESSPFVDFKRRSSKLCKAHQVEAAKTTGNDNVVSTENQPPKRRKLIRPKFGEET
ncbi:unnamed protein product [Linum trigynum]|uniref:DCD domain-containing protein n=1 Tax=Linum trigynum TaxID=586398 RepID=A0AAV2C9Z0_9ROSI